MLRRVTDEGAEVDEFAARFPFGGRIRTATATAVVVVVVATTSGEEQATMTVSRANRRKNHARSLRMK